MKLSEIINEFENYAPLSLSKEYCEKFSMYDNSGLILNCSSEIFGIIFSLDFSYGAVNTAIEKGYNLIITHHPAIFGGIKSLDTQNDDLSKKIALCIQNGISVYCAHLNLDAAERGVDYYLMQGLGGKNAKIMDKLSQGGYGRVYEIEPKNFATFCQSAKKTFNSEKCRFYGEPNKLIAKVASFCGAGTEEKSLKFALNYGVDAVVSSDMKHHNIATLCEKGVAVIELTHYASENYGFISACKNIAKNISLPVEYHTDEIYL